MQTDDKAGVVFAAKKRLFLSLILVSFKNVINPYPGTIFFLKIKSAFYFCCIYTNALKTIFDHGSKHYEP